MGREPSQLLGLVPCTCSTALIRTTSQEQRGEGREGQQRGGGTVSPHSTAMEQNSLILFSEDKNHFKYPGGEKENIWRGVGMKRKTQK